MNRSLACCLYISACAIVAAMCRVDLCSYLVAVASLSCVVLQGKSFKRKKVAK